MQGASSFREDAVLAVIKQVLQELSGLGFIEIKDDLVILTKTGKDLSATQAAKSELLATQFANSLKLRALTFLPDEPRAIKVSNAAEAFIKECIDRRALGVAMAMFAANIDYHNYHMVALLQKLPDFISQLDNIEEATALIRCGYKEARTRAII